MFLQPRDIFDGIPLIKARLHLQFSLRLRMRFSSSGGWERVDELQDTRYKSYESYECSE